MLKTNVSFNYIITVHNKEDLIRDVMIGVIHSAGLNSTIYPVLDGCTDSSESIIDDISRLYPKVKIVKLFADDVHELRSINIGLMHSNQNGEGYNIILQDDVILEDKKMESKCIHLYSQFNQLGILSFRHGGNISRKGIHYPKYSPLIDYIQNQCGHNVNPSTMLKTGSFTFREVAIKSPICIPFKIIREQGIPNELYAPWDDLGYCYRISNAGYCNGVLALNFVSDVDWGSTRAKKQKISIFEVACNNMDKFTYFHPDIPPLDSLKYDNKIHQIFSA